MRLELCWMDGWIDEGLIGFGLGTIDLGYIVRSLFSVYWGEGIWLIDLFWFRIYTGEN